jgi:hypothetical protein
MRQEPEKRESENSAPHDTARDGQGAGPRRTGGSWRAFYQLLLSVVDGESRPLESRHSTFVSRVPHFMPSGCSPEHHVPAAVLGNLDWS